MTIRRNKKASVFLMLAYWSNGLPYRPVSDMQIGQMTHRLGLFRFEWEYIPFQT